MPYLIRSKGGSHSMRDGVDGDSPVYDLSCTEFTPFNTLPKGTSATGDSDVEVIEVESLEGQKYREPVLSKGSAKPKKAKKKAKPVVDPEPMV